MNESHLFGDRPAGADAKRGALEHMARTPRMAQIEAMLADDPDDAFLRYGLAMEHASAGDHATCVEVLRDLIARTAANPYVPAYSGPYST